ncbi:E3 ubiquitin-protein ligase Mdm2-like isoform X2 [Toxorhynchites rutilus septentrionalis]|nr:E3 ubiquitin-protein ligase Mdm2-like isoform X2 [Toxorhynchites rutilus septentrionalis]XP_055635111.1 E3 ubiquitin-protein ligase Mdm2-like isoform X2 [Toxorhynchites rutilus septentrionalis]
MFDETGRDRNQFVKSKNQVFQRHTFSKCSAKLERGVSRSCKKNVFLKNNKRKFQDNTQSFCGKKRRDEVGANDASNCTSVQMTVFKDSGFSSSSSQEIVPLEEKQTLFEENSSHDVCRISKIIQTPSRQNHTLLKQSLSYTTLSQVSSVSTNSVSSSYKEDDTNNEDKSDVFCESQSPNFNLVDSNSGGSLGDCMFCLSEPKNSVFVHSNFVHLCCCYKCAVKIWKQRKACPICNCKVKNVMKLFVH